MCLLNCARVKDHLHDSENWPRSPFDRSNFVRLSSTLRILGFHSNWMENRCRVVLKRCGNVIGRNACKFDTKIILMPLWKETIAWTVDIARSLAMLQKNTQCTRSAHIEFWMQLNSLFNKCRRTVILIFTKLCHRKKSSRTWEHLSDGPLDFWLGVRGGAGGLGNKPQKNRSQP